MTTAELTTASPAALAAELESALDPRTREILERRRASGVVRRRGWLVRRMLAAADVLGLTLAFFFALWFFNGDSATALTDRIDPRLEALFFLLTLPAWVVMAKLYGLYERDEERTDHSTADDFGGVFHMITVGAWGVFVIGTLTPFADPQLDKIIGFWFLAIAFVCTFRASARAYCRRQVTYLQNTVIVGAGDVGQLIAKKYLQHPEYGINLVGFVDAEPKTRRDDLGHLTLLGAPPELPSLIKLFDVERVVIAFSREAHDETLDLIRRLKDLDVQVDVVPRLFEVLGPGVELHTVEGVPLVGLAPPRLSRSSYVLKRAMDLVLTVPGIIVLAPLLAIIAVAVKLDSRGPVIYQHERVGRRGNLINVKKFRTMRLEACRGEAYGGEAAESEFRALMADPDLRAQFAASYKLQRDPRVTRVGRILRKTSLDELPQLFNVLAGELSLVGPRPLVREELTEFYGDQAERILTVPPGVTGYWQVNGRSGLAYEDRVRLDIAYIAGWSLRLDLAILARTVRVMLSRSGAC